MLPTCIPTCAECDNNASSYDMKHIEYIDGKKITSIKTQYYRWCHSCFLIWANNKPKRKETMKCLIVDDE